MCFRAAPGRDGLLNFHSGHGLGKQLDGFHKSTLLPTTFAEFGHWI